MPTSDRMYERACKMINADFSKILGYTSYGFSLKKMLISCKFNDILCDETHFFKVTSTIFNSCYSFNRGMNSTGHSTPILKLKRPGMESGLKMELYVGAPEYHPCWSVFQGALVVVHNASINPLFVEDGVRISTGFENNVVLSKRVFEKLAKPYSDCVEDLYSNSSLTNQYSLYTLDAYGIYTRKWCILSCALAKNNDHQLKACVNYTNSSTPSYSACVADTTDMPNYYPVCYELCPVECSSTIFESKLTVSKYPTLAKAEKFKHISQISLSKCIVRSTREKHSFVERVLWLGKSRNNIRIAGNFIGNTSGQSRRSTGPIHRVFSNSTNRNS